jgi:hypothetical protein
LVRLFFSRNFFLLEFRRNFGKSPAASPKKMFVFAYGMVGLTVGGVVGYQIFKQQLQSSQDEENKFREEIEYERKLPKLGGDFRLVNENLQTITQDHFRGKICMM